MLAMPEADSIRAKLFSAAAESMGVPSSKSWSPETARSKPASLSPRAVFNSVQAVSYCLAVRGWPKSYIRANLSRMFKLRTKARAAVVRLSALMAMGSRAGLPAAHNRMKGKALFGNGTRFLSCTNV
jgi:hypothetical protein